MSVFRRSVLTVVPPLLILLFAYTGINKLQERKAFETVLAYSPWIGSFASLVSFALPIGEILLACLLFFPSVRKAALRGSFVLLVGFSLYVGGLMLFAPYLPCSCGGVIRSLSWPAHLLLNMGLTAMTGLTIHYTSSNTLRNNRGSQKPVEKSRQIISY